MLLKLLALICCIAVIPVNGLRCYQGQKASMLPSQDLVPSECPASSDRCVNAHLTINMMGMTIPMIIGQCQFAAFCAVDGCKMVTDMLTKMLGNDMRIDACNITCCDSDLCNEVADGGPTPPIHPRPPVRRESQRCWEGDWQEISGMPSAGNDGKHEVTCPSPTQTCFIMRNSVVMMGMDMTMNTASCMERMQCSMNNSCSMIMSAMAESGATIKQCDSTCCEGDMCNTSEKQFSGDSEDDEEEDDDEDEEDDDDEDEEDDDDEDEEDDAPSCNMKKKKHNSCCGDRSYDDTKFECCMGASSAILYKPKKKGCCNGKLFKTKKRVCVDGTITSLKKIKKQKKAKKGRMP